jgi:hypothetical protein
MPLSAFTPDLTRYGWSVARDAAARRLTFSIAERASGARLGERDLEVMHEHPLHLFIVSEDFRSFEHLHPTPTPTPRGNEWTVAWRPRASGAYRLYGDFLPIGGPPQMLQRQLTTGSRTSNVDAVADRLVSTDHGMQGTLNIPPLRAGDSHRLTITLRDTAADRPITDLDPYRGAISSSCTNHATRRCTRIPTASRPHLAARRSPSTSSFRAPARIISGCRSSSTAPS